jgi:hypothetical protein
LDNILQRLSDAAADGSYEEEEEEEEEEGDGDAFRLTNRYFPHLPLCQCNLLLLNLGLCLKV